MKLDLLISDIIPEDEVQKGLEIAFGCSANFLELVRALQLNRKFDFQNSNLREIDFSNSDLRGFNFSGSDLRDSYGVNVKLDSTTILSGADLEGSFLAKYAREQRLFEANPKAQHFYNLLKSADASEVAIWAGDRYLRNTDRHIVFKEMDEEVASTLCQKLLSDEINLTKRTSLFYFLRDFTNGAVGLRETVLEIIALHSDNIPVIKSFIRVAGQIFTRDPAISQAIYALCRDSRVEVRESAFLALATTKFTNTNVNDLEKIFMLEENSHIRKKLLREAAIKLSNRHLLSINLKNRTKDLEIRDVIDFEQLLKIPVAAKVTLSQNERKNPLNPSEVIRFQEDVIMTTPLISQFFGNRHRERAKTIRQRLMDRKFSLLQETESKISNSFRRGWFRK